MSRWHRFLTVSLLLVLAATTSSHDGPDNARPRDRRRLLEEFAAARDTNARLRLLPEIRRVCNDDELPQDVRYLLALSLLRPHLTWHAAWAPDEDKHAMGEYKWRDGGDNPWREAHGGEAWMWDDVPPKVRDALAEQRERLKRKDLPRRAETEPSFFWRLREPGHADVRQALKLLDKVQGEQAGDARRWAAEVRRNNTVVTFEGAGGFVSGCDAQVVLDVRNGDSVRLRLYRLRQPDDLLWVTRRIGTDFLFRDYDLHEAEERKVLRELQGHARRLPRLRPGDEKVRPPEFLRTEPVWHQEARLAELPGLTWGQRWSYDGREEEEDDYFDDACSEFHLRLEKIYRPEQRQLTSWWADRIVRIPAAALRQAGAYVLAGEVNGQVAYFPVIVDPLSMTLRRCRDGVFVLASDNEGRQPIAGAGVHAVGLMGKTVTDAEGAAFARVFASGERALVLHKDGRFAIGGFGRVFDGVYHSMADHWYWHRRHRDRLQRHDEVAALQVYADRHVVAALTDRPTYRPGQLVQFKVIVRKLEEATAADRPQSFRAEDFEVAGRLTLPAAASALPYELLDPRGRVVATGRLTLNDYGTAAGQAELNAEAATGAYTLRVRVGGAERLVPEMFAVRSYRRPHFELEVRGVPAKARPGTQLRIEAEGRYYFGKHVAAGRMSVALISAEERKPRQQVEAVLDGSGKAVLRLLLPQDLDGGDYFLACELTDDSGRTVTRALALTIENARPTAGGLASLPRFVPLREKREIATSAREVVLEQWREDRDGAATKLEVAFPVRAGRAIVAWPGPGWYIVRAGDATTEVFIYGGTDSPRATRPHQADGSRRRQGQWVDLTDYAREEDGGRGERDLMSSPLLALFDRQQVRVGDKLKVLVYVPCKRARLLLTAEGRTVLDYFTTWTADEAGYYHVVEVPIKRRYLPNFYLQGAVLSEEGPEPAARKWLEKRSSDAKSKEKEERGEDPRWCRMDVVDPAATPDGQSLKVEVRPDREDHRPGEAVGVRMAVTDLQGRPKEAEVCLSAVDESVYVFGEDRAGYLARLFSDPHPPQRYWRKSWRCGHGDRWSATRERRQAETIALEELQKAMAMAEGRDEKHGEGKLAAGMPEPRTPGLGSPLALRGEVPATTLPLARLRSDFRETAAWQPQLRTGADGIVRTSFRLPDSLTCYRLTAVGLTCQSEVGIGSARIRVSLPLAVQVFLPRFAVEKDRLQAVAVIHNAAPHERTCDIVWTVEGARVDAPPRVSGIRIPANGTARVELWLALEEPREVAVRCQARAGEDVDAEARTLAVQPRGREREVSFDGTFRGKTQVRFPAGFVARDLHVVLARGDVARALDGLAPLIDYPYGCVEQTMSRFLPAVVIKQAIQKVPVRLPAEAAEKLPEVLRRGLARLYNFQHADGGWGWWEHDATDQRMTAYVVDGLVRCQLAGVTVDPDVLRRGIAFLRQELAADKLLPPVAAQAWLAIALAGQADLGGLSQAARAAIEKGTAEDRCRMALASRAAGLSDLAERLWGITRSWQPETTSGLALVLTAQLKFGALRADCQATAAHLMARRVGLGWENTQATASALEALAEMLPRIAAGNPARSVAVEVGGKSLLSVKAEELGSLVYLVHAGARELPVEEALTINLQADCEEAVFYTVVAAGIQHLDAAEAIGNDVKVHRVMETLDGKPLSGPVRTGEVVRVRLTVELARAEQYLLLEDRRPAGAEFADEILQGDARSQLAHQEFRDDRLSLFFAALPAGRHEVVYYLRGETPGTSHWLPGVAYPMYSPTRRGESSPAHLEVLPLLPR
jgi:hypothetical protein